MSLLNDMLQDLQQQPDKDHEISDEYNRTQLRESGIIKTTSVPWIATVVVFVTVLLVLLVVKQKFDHQKENLIKEIVTIAETDSPTPMHSLESNSSVPAMGIKQENIQLSKNAPNAETPQAEQIHLAIAPEQKIQIDQLLIRARQAIARNRLTSPFEDNAFRYYQEILAIEPENILATQGLLQLADSYLVMADKKLATGNPEAVQQLLQRAQLVAPDYPAVKDFVARVQTILSDKSIELPPVLVEEVNQSGSEINETSETEISAENNTPAPMSESISDPFTRSNDTPYLSVTPNLHWQDQQTVGQAKLLVQQGKTAQAIVVLEDFVRANRGASESTRLLLDMYCEQQKIEDAQTLLASADYLEKVDQFYFKARIALVNQQPQEAIALLEAGLGMAEKQEHYRALLAGVYQKAAHYPQAASSYKRLLEVFGEKPAYWLGYALALDAMQQKASALQAYQRLAEYQELQTEVRQYIEQRIAALQG